MNSRLLSACGALTLLLAGCGPTPIAYHSTASVPYYTSSISTQMEATQRQEKSVGEPYVVFAALDDESTGYVLMAPTGGSSRGSNFDAADFNRAVPLKGENLDTLIDGISGAIEQWATESEGRGTFYEFVHAPEDDIQRVSENVVQYHAAVRFTISRTEDGPIGQLVLGASPDEQLQSVIEMKDKEAVETFRDLLRRAQKRAGKMKG